MSLEAFSETAYYDAVISNYFNEILNINFPKKKLIYGKLVEKLFFSTKGYKASSEDPAIYIPIWIVAISLIYFGIFSSPIVEISSIAADSLIKGGFK